MRHRGMLLAALCLLIAASSRPASAASDLNAYLGLWAGLSQGLVDPPEPDRPARLEILSAQNRRLQGVLELVPAVIPVELTISASGIINGGGSDSEGDRVQLHGQVRGFADGSVRFLFGDGSVRVAALRYNVFFGDGSVRKGHAAFVQMIGGADWEHTGGVNVSGRWMGTWGSSVGPGGGCLEMDLQNLKGRQGETTGLTGLGMFEDFPLGGSMMDLVFGLQGTIGLPAVQDGTSNAALIGLLRPAEGGSTQGIIAILIGLLLPAVQDNPTTLQGEYLLYNSLSDMFMDFTRGGGGALDRGSFSLPAVQ